VKRHEKVRNTIPKYSGAIVCDVKNFYPSIHQNDLENNFISFIDKIASINSDMKSLLTKYFKEYMAVLRENGYSMGIGIGPAFSHFLANFYLRFFDMEMNELFGEKYSRYVDDMIILYNQDEKENSIDRITGLLKKYNLELNSEKTDFISKKEWLEFDPYTDRKKYSSFQDTSLFKLKTQTTLFLYYKKDKTTYEELLSKFRSNNFTLPINIWKNDSNDKPHISFITSIIQSLKIRNFKIQSVDTLLKQAIDLRNFINTELLNLLKQNVPSEKKTVRKWHIQKIKYFLSQYIYLNSPDQYISVLEDISLIDEVKSFSILMSDLKNKCISKEILQLSGRLIITFSSIFTTAYPGEKVNLVWDDSFCNECIINSLEVLAIYDIISISDINFNKLDKKQKELLYFCFEQKIIEREIKDLSYIDEIRTLQLNKQKGLIKYFMENRFSPDEMSTPLSSFFESYIS